MPLTLNDDELYILDYLIPYWDNELRLVKITRDFEYECWLYDFIYYDYVRKDSYQFTVSSNTSKFLEINWDNISKIVPVEIDSNLKGYKTWLAKKLT